MLSKHQTDAVAEAILDQPHPFRRAALGAPVRAIALMYRSTELSSLPPQERNQVIRRAVAVVNRSPYAILSLLAWLAAIVILWWYGVHVSHMAELKGLFIPGWIGPILIHGLFVRHTARKLAMEAKSSESATGGQG